MNKTAAKGATNVEVGTLSADQAKKRVYEQGLTLKEFAKNFGLKYRTVSEVLRGVNKGLHGEGHRAAKALRMK